MAQFPPNIDVASLDGTNGFRNPAALGRALGDVNGDGFDDIVFVHDGATYVLFGKASGFPASNDLGTVDGTNGFKIDGLPSPAGIRTDAAGDVNGDGLADIVVGSDSGSTYVVFGRASGFDPTLNLASLDGSNGFRMNGGAHRSVGSAGDVNGDGFDDVNVGTPYGSPAAWVVFGKAAGFPAVVDLGELDGSNGFKFTSSDGAGGTTTSAGDINGDGFDDAFFNAWAGSGYVVFGKASGFPAHIDASTLDGTNGFRLTDVSTWLAPAGDVNGDGLADMIVLGASREGYVLFGKAAGFPAVSSAQSVDGTNGFRIANSGNTPWVDGAGDVNGDGFDDVIVGSYSGCWVVFGKASGFTSDIDVTTLDGTNGFSITRPGLLAARAGDVNDDGFDDVVVGDSGAVVFGRAPDTAVNLVGTVASQHLSGGNFDDILSGLGGDDILRGNGGADVLDGGLGNDTAVYSNSPGGVTVNLTTNVNSGGDAQGDTLFGIENIVGSALVDSLTGDVADNTFEGRAGADTIDGAGGNDTASYIHSTAAVTVNLATNVNVGGDAEGDSLTSIENVIGSSLNDSLTGDGSANVLDGRAGADVMAGGDGDDTYFVNDPNDQVTEAANEGTDNVRSVVSYILNPNVENLLLLGNDAINGTGNSLDNTITGNAGDNELDGGAGADTLNGGGGNDTAVYANSANGVTVNLATNVNTGGDAQGDTLNAIANLVGSALADSLTGDGNPNRLDGGDGGDTLDGGGGADVMTGGLGDDHYVVDNAGDQVIESANAGIDEVHSSIDHVLAPNVEDLTLTGGAIHGTGNVLSNTITGTAGDNFIDGALGADTMIGQAGGDTYFVDGPSDQIIELAGEGTDAVEASWSYVLPSEVENLYLTGSALNGVGNASPNFMVGNAGDNGLDGGGGADLMLGGVGNDNYLVDQIGDRVVENLGEGNDTITTTVSYVLSANVENLTQAGGASINAIGNGLDNIMTGNGGNNGLDGGGGADTMAGGAGNDYYFVDDAADRVIENSGEGTDAVIASVNHTLEANVEILALTGSGNLHGVGNGLANDITGNDGANLLDGGGAADMLTGGAGNDVFVFAPGEADGDTVTDFAGNGAAAGDALVFSGYGAGATFTNIDATHWQVNYNAGANHDVITFSNAAAIDPTDFLFV
jgi:Ca2+-binding RTX toxin-like protein